MGVRLLSVINDILVVQRDGYIGTVCRENSTCSESIISGTTDVEKKYFLTIIEKREKCIRKKLEVYTEVYIVHICVYFHVILPYLV
jgi:hypothetical protein